MHFEDEMMRNRLGFPSELSGFRSASVQIPQAGQRLYSYTFLFDFVLDTITTCDVTFLKLPVLLPFALLHAFASV
jgi:hypothetical protein